MLNLLLFLQDSTEQIIQQGPNPAAEHLAMGFLAILPILILITLVVIIVPFWFICKKAGLSPWLSMLNIIPFGNLNIIPFGNLVLIYILAFSDWKVVPAPQFGFPPNFPPPPYPQQPPYPPLPPTTPQF
jgi:hypothetical protein